MEQIDNKKFGLFIIELRKEKNFTQKELGEKLYVTDKTVSKWERGLSIPNVSLLMPLASILGVTVTELLKGEKIQEQEKLNKQEVNQLISNSLDLTLKQTLKQKKKRWIIIYWITVLIVISELYLLFSIGISFTQMKSNVLLVTSLMLGFSTWFCFIARELLPSYYDEYKVNYFTQGILRMHMPGLSFNNSNWPYLCVLIKLWCLGSAILYPLVCIVTNYINSTLWQTLENILIWIIMFGLFISMYIVGKKYE